MAPKKKTNPFMTFVMEWKSKYGRHMSTAEAVQHTGKIWETMNSEQRQPYLDKVAKAKTTQAPRTNKLASDGTPLAYLVAKREAEAAFKKNMKREVELSVRESLKNGVLEDQSYFFLMVNYFVRAQGGYVYIPAEVSVNEFSLKNGNIRNYHSLINPETSMYGMYHDAQAHSQATHKLPLPPDALGSVEGDAIYNNLLSFICNKKTGKYPPIYTHEHSVEVVRSVLDYLRQYPGASELEFQVYSIQHLLHVMKTVACEMAQLSTAPSHFISDTYFNRDRFDFSDHISCEFHEKIDRGKYCTLSMVQRWGFMFCDYLCKDMAIRMIPGRHLPIDGTNSLSEFKPQSACQARREEAEKALMSSSTAQAKPWFDQESKYNKDDISTASGSNKTNKVKKESLQIPDVASDEMGSVAQALKVEEEPFDLNPWNIKKGTTANRGNTGQDDDDWTTVRSKSRSKTNRWN